MENKYLINAVKSGSFTAIELSRRAGWSDAMVNRLKRWSKRVTPEQAVKLEIASDGEIDAAKLNPEFFKTLERIGYRKQKSNTKAGVA